MDDNDVLGYATGRELFLELKKRYDGDLAQIYAYIMNSRLELVGLGQTEKEMVAGEALDVCTEYVQAEIVENYMLEHGFHRPEDSDLNKWEANEENRVIPKKTMKFGEFRKYISKIDRVSICNKKTLSYENYMLISEVPDSYDDMYLYGIGRTDSEFRADQAPEVAVKLGVDLGSEEGKAEMIYAPCIEIMLSDEPREEE